MASHKKVSAKGRHRKDSEKGRPGLVAAAAGGVLCGALFVSNASAAEPTGAQSTGAEDVQSSTDQQTYQEVQPGGAEQQPAQAQVSEPAFATPDARDRRQADAGPKVEAIHTAGPSTDNFDLTFVGEGYTAAEQDQLRSDTRKMWEGLSKTEPWNKYRDRTNVWLIFTVSKQSGVDNDQGTKEKPKTGGPRDTALNVGFKCDGVTQRLLCNNSDYPGDKANSFAKRYVPATDATAVIANTDSYGGSGGKGAAVVSARDPQSVDVLAHEIAHSVADLADEYFTPRTWYTGPEPTEPNVTKDPCGRKFSPSRQCLDPDLLESGGKGKEFGIYHLKAASRLPLDSKMGTVGRDWSPLQLKIMDNALQSLIH
ncbi:M64 family metallopeptidase [Streptomyces sp. NPDC002730]|uniref:M64 family metallopeptidase n=1 Tax=Streptomyces sp. NPDC002730 TaxID=3364662 RepID=UPI0036C79EDF